VLSARAAFTEGHLRGRAWILTLVHSWPFEDGRLEAKKNAWFRLV
jgi:hypothetical protein